MSFDSSNCLLAVETSTAQASVALWGQQGLRYEASFAAGRGEKEYLYAELERILQLLEEHERVVLVVGLGPGSYTGVRKGIAAAQGLALARGWTCVGLPLGASLLSLATGKGFLCGDAKRGEWFLQVYEGAQLGELQFFSPRDFLKELENLPPWPLLAVENFWLAHKNLNELALQQLEQCIVRESAEARVLAQTAWQLGEPFLRELAQQALFPFYLRAPLIT